MDVGPSELLIILAVVMLLFGGKKLPELARSIGQAKREFERGTKGETADEPEAAPVAEADGATATTEVVDTTAVEAAAPAEG